MVHAHLAALDWIREHPAEATEIMARESKIPKDLTEIARVKAGWDRNIVPRDWIEITVEDLYKLKLISRKYSFEEVTDYSLQEGYVKTKF